MQASKLLFLLLLPLFSGACNPEAGNPKKADAPAPDGVNTGTNAAPAAAGGGKQELMFVLADQSVTKGDTVCVDIAVRHFNNILSMQYSMNWNPRALKFLKLEGLNLKDLSMNNFGMNRTDQGKMGTAWFDLAVKGITLPDNTPIYRVCFIAVGDAGTSDQIFFSSEPVVIEISNSAEELLGLAFKRANITIQ